MLDLVTKEDFTSSKRSSASAGLFAESSRARMTSIGQAFTLNGSEQGKKIGKLFVSVKYRA